MPDEALALAVPGVLLYIQRAQSHLRFSSLGFILPPCYNDLKITIGGIMKLLSLFAQADGYSTDPYMYDTSTYETYNSAGTQISNETAVAVLLFTLIFSLVIGLIVYAISAFLLGRIFKKAGVEAWKAWVPVYNMWVLLELGGQKGFWAVLALVPVVNIVSIVFLIIAQYNIGLKLQKEGWFVLLAIFLSPVWLIWLAFDKSTWEGKGTASPEAATANGAPASTTTPPTPPEAPASPTPPAETPPKEQ
jgi:hypothetical protein